MNRPIETLLFDFGGTLDADGVAWKERFYSCYRAEGLDMSADSFATSFFAADDPLVGNLPPASELRETVHALVADLEAELARRETQSDLADPCSSLQYLPHRGRSNSNGGRNVPRGTRVAQHFLSDCDAAFARNRPVLEILRQRYQLGLVSNFYGNLDAVCRGAGLASFFTALVDSHCVGAEKPDPAIFRVALERLGAEPDTTVLIGDSLRRDREGARRTGMGFIWMSPEHARSAKACECAPAGVEHTVAELRELLNMLP